MSGWYTRPVIFVTDTERAIAFYADKLGFARGWRYQEAGRAVIAQIGREGCEIILCEQQSEKTGRGRLFISLDVVDLDALRTEFESRGAPVREGWWGYDLMVVEDPDGNELFFPYPAAPAA